MISAKEARELRGSREAILSEQAEIDYTIRYTAYRSTSIEVEWMFKETIQMLRELGYEVISKGQDNFHEIGWIIRW